MSRVFLMGLMGLLALSCSSAPLPNSLDSTEALARAVLTAIETRDAETLRSLAVSREEFTEHVWPELPAARPKRNLSASFVWGSLNQKSSITLRQTLAAHGGRKYQLVGVRFLQGTTRYPSFQVHREGELTLQDSDGNEKQVRVFGSVLEKAGRYKVFSYVIDD